MLSRNPVALAMLFGVIGTCQNGEVTDREPILGHVGILIKLWELADSQESYSEERMKLHEGVTEELLPKVFSRSIPPRTKKLKENVLGEVVVVGIGCIQAISALKNICTHSRDVLSRIIVGSEVLNFLLEFLHVTSSMLFVEFHNTQEQNWEGFIDILESFNGSKELGLQRVFEKLASRTIILKIIRVIQQDLGLHLFRENSKASKDSVAINDVHHLILLDSAGDIRDCVHSVVFELLLDFSSEEEKVVSLSKLGGDSSATGVFTGDGTRSRSWARLAIGLTRTRVFKPSPVMLGLSAGVSNELFARHLHDVSHNGHNRLKDLYVTFHLGAGSGTSSSRLLGRRLGGFFAHDGRASSRISQLPNANRSKTSVFGSC
jgi:hypothetical protein